MNITFLKKMLKLVKESEGKPNESLIDKLITIALEEGELDSLIETNQSIYDSKSSSPKLKELSKKFLDKAKAYKKEDESFESVLSSIGEFLSNSFADFMSEQKELTTNKDKVKFLKSVLSTNDKGYLHLQGESSSMMKDKSNIIFDSEGEISRLSNTPNVKFVTGTKQEIIDAILKSKAFMHDIAFSCDKDKNEIIGQINFINGTKDTDVSFSYILHTKENQGPFTYCTRKYDLVDAVNDGDIVWIIN